MAIGKLLLPILAVLGANSVPASEIPDTVTSERYDKPIWVASDIAVETDGAIREELFNEIELDLLHGYARKFESPSSPEGCSFVVISGCNPVPEGVDQLIGDSRLAFVGIVRESRDGLGGSFPSLMLSIEAESNLRGKTVSILASIPEARVKVGNVVACSSSRAFGRPEPGQRIAIFVQPGGPLEFTPPFEGLIGYEVFLEGPDGELLPPPRFEELSAWSFNDLIQHAKQVLSQGSS